jgi:GNAT superfamily N-acetyltransferase
MVAKNNPTTSNGVWTTLTDVVDTAPAGECDLAGERLGDHERAVILLFVDQPWRWKGLGRSAARIIAGTATRARD